MSIELLWIVPVVAVGLGFFLIALLLQRKSDASQYMRSGDTAVKEYTRKHSDSSAVFVAPSVNLADNRRIGEIEGRLERLTTELTEQKQTVQRFQQENNACYSEINDLRSKLRSLHKEYDIVISENFSLRARVKKLKKQFESSSNGAGPSVPNRVCREVYSSADNDSSQVAMRLFGDTRQMEVVDLEDTGEIDLAELNV